MKFFRLIAIIVTGLSVLSACDSSGDLPPSEEKTVSKETEEDSTASGSIELEKIAVLALGPADSRVVVSQEEGKMQVLKVGDTLPGTNATILQVLHDKLVVEDTVEKEGESPVKQVVWIFKVKKNQGVSRVQRLDPVGPEKPTLQHPNIVKE